ncbi:MAG TPA: extracellular solute-binding protein [Limnochordia bacterium]|nr:extracellular solute-binding protein [Limnochordia bacterium]
MGGRRAHLGVWLTILALWIGAGGSVMRAADAPATPALSLCLQGVSLKNKSAAALFDALAGVDVGLPVRDARADDPDGNCLGKGPWSARLAAMAQPGAPDLYLLQNEDVAAAAASGAALDLSPFARVQNGLRSDLATLPQPLLPLAGSTLRGIPFSVDIGGFVYIKNTFRQLGLAPNPDWTWSDFLVTADKLKAYYNFFAVHNRFATGIGFNADQIEALVPFFWSNGGELLSDDGTQVLFDSTVNRDTAQWIAALFQRNSITLFDNARGIYGAFVGNQLGMVPGTLSQGLAGFSFRRRRIDTGWLPYPVAPSGQSVSPLTEAAVIVNDKTANPVAAVQVARWLFGDGQRFAGSFGPGFPVRTELLPVSATADQKAIMDMALKAAQTGRTAHAIMAASGEPTDPNSTLVANLAGLAHGTLPAWLFMERIDRALQQMAPKPGEAESSAATGDSAGAATAPASS